MGERILHSHHTNNVHARYVDDSRRFYYVSFYFGHILFLFESHSVIASDRSAVCRV